MMIIMVAVGARNYKDIVTDGIPKICHCWHFSNYNGQNFGSQPFRKRYHLYNYAASISNNLIARIVEERLSFRKIIAGKLEDCSCQHLGKLCLIAFQTVIIASSSKHVIGYFWHIGKYYC